METTNIVDLTSRDRITDALTELLKKAAQHSIATAVKAQLEICLTQFASTRTQAVTWRSCAMGIIHPAPSKLALVL